jgi:hypothetical protein
VTSKASPTGLGDLMLVTLSLKSVSKIDEFEIPRTGNYVLSVSRNIFSICDSSNFQKREVTL